MPANNGLPPYVGQGIEQVLLAPYRAEKVRFLGFIVKAKTDNLNDLLKRCLNCPSEGRLNFTTRIPYVLFYYADIPLIASTSSKDKNLGGTSEREVAAVVFAEEQNTDKLYAFFPYMFVNIGSAMSAGREVYGFPKQLAKISVTPSSPPAVVSDRLVVSRESKVLFKPDLNGAARANSSTRPLIRVTFPAALTWDRITGKKTKVTWPWTTFEQVRTALSGLMKRKDIAKTLVLSDAETNAVLQLVSGGTISMVFLKQFRDVEDPSRACYQTVIEAEAAAEKFYRGRNLVGKPAKANPDGTPGKDLDPFRITFLDNTIRADLGLNPGVIRPVASFFLEFDFTIQAGKRLLP